MPKPSRSMRLFLCERRAYWRSVACSLAIFVACLVARAAHADKWALLIGIDNYKDSARINSLSSAAADARALKAALVEAEGVPEANVKLLVSDANPALAETEGKPERNAILRALSSLAKNVKPGDTVFVFFSGHGIEKNGSSYLLPYDTDAFDDNTITDTAIDTARFRDRLQAVHAGLLILAFDMCRNNPMKGSRDAAGGGNTLTPSQVRGLDFAGITANGGSAPVPLGDGPHAVVTLFSCSPDERSYEWIGKGRGYFSWFLEQGLRGAKDATSSDGTVHVDTLTSYVAQSVPIAVKREEAKTQTPLVEISGQIEASHIALTSIAAVAPTPTKDSKFAAVVTDTHAYITVAVEPVGAAITVDGIPQHPTAGRLAIDLGGAATKTVEIGVEQQGYQSHVEQLTLTRGTIVPFAVALAASATTVLPPPTSSEPNAGSLKINPKDGAATVYVPAGPFLMGDDARADNPRHTVTLSAFYIYKNDVTVAQYRAYCSATGKAMPAPPPWGWKEDHPIVNVSWDDAKAYCAWAGCRLPTEAEWEKAARGEKGQKYPWGDEWDPSRLCCSSTTVGDAGGTHSVGGFPSGASPYGALDMAGNVWNWCEDGYDKDYMSGRAATEANPVNESATAGRVLRGGSWFDSYSLLFRAASRSWYAPLGRYGFAGFRCVVNAGPP